MKEIYLQPNFLKPEWGMHRIKLYKNKIVFIDEVTIKEFDRKKGWKDIWCASITTIDREHHVEIFLYN